MTQPTAEQLPPVELTEDQRTGLIAAIASAYPPYRVWWSAGIWYATCPGRTLHAPYAGALAEQLDAAKAV